MMRKTIIISFLISILIISSCNCLAYNIDNKNNLIDRGTNNIYIPNNSQTEIDDFLNNIEEETSSSEHLEIQNIINRVVKSQKDNEKQEVIVFDLYELGCIIKEYNYEGVNSYYQDESFIDDAISFLISCVQERLGWVYTLIEKTTNIIQETQTIMILSKQTINAVKELYNAAKDILNLTTYLLQRDFSGFLKGWYPQFYINKIQAIVSSLQTIVSNVPEIINLVQQTITDATDFKQWLQSDPWTAPVVIYGEVKQIKGTSTTPIENVKIECREKVELTDINGEYIFTVKVDDTSDDSIPENSWYGAHNCQVTAEKDGELKTNFIPYVFAGGKIYTLFLFNEKNSDIKQNTLSFRYFHILIEFISYKYTYLSRIINSL